MKITNDHINCRVYREEDGKDNWLFVTGISQNHSDLFIAYDKMKSIKGAKTDDNWIVIKENRFRLWLINFLMRLLEELSPFRKWYKIVRKANESVQ